MGWNNMTIMDGLRNIVANLGTDRDKAAHSYYYNTTIADDQLVAMYRTSAIARNVVDLPAEDATREWREWQADAEQITAIEAEEKRLGLQGKTMQNIKRARLFGGAAIYIGTRDLDASKPLDPARIGKGGLQYLAVLNRSEITAGAIQRDPRLPGFGKPVTYRMNPATGASVEIHPSRLVIAVGEEVPDDRYSAHPGWGDSTLNATISAVRNLDATIANVASLVFEAKIDVIGINGFNEGLRSGGSEYEAVVIARTGLTARGKGINGALLMDSDDTYDQKTASFATLPDIIDRFMQMVAAAAGVPMTRLFGIAAAGMNATGAGDEKVYFDRVRVMQTLDLDPAMEILNECLIRSALGNRPPELHWTWRPLFQPTAKERADMGKVLVDSVKVLYDMDILPQEALADTIVNTLTESGAFPGLEGKVKEFFNVVESDE
jgi:hypothetical protein